MDFDIYGLTRLQSFKMKLARWLLPKGVVVTVMSREMYNEAKIPLQQAARRIHVRRERGKKVLQLKSYVNGKHAE